MKLPILRTAFLAHCRHDLTARRLSAHNDNRPTLADAGERAAALDGA